MNYGILRPQSVLQYVESEEPLDLKKLQGLVGGYIEHPFKMPSVVAPDEEVSVWCNDEGKLDQLPFSCYFEAIQDTIAGPLVITGASAEGETIGLRREDFDRFVLGPERLIVQGLPFVLKIKS